MPKLDNQRIYKATYITTKEIIQSSSGHHPNIKFKNYTPGEYLYRYSPSQFGSGHIGNMMVYRNVDEDTENRWTGQSVEGLPGHIGLYTTPEQVGKDETVFAELFQYMKSDNKNDKNAKTDISIYDFQGRIEGDEVKHELAPAETINAHRLHYMFAYTLTKKIKILDLQLPLSPVDRNSLANTVFQLARLKAPAAFMGINNCSDLYRHDSDASFCRALGNACLQYITCDGIMTTSARDNRAINVILRTQKGVQNEFLQFAGRSSFFVDPARLKVIGFHQDVATLQAEGSAESESDMEYNSKHFVTEIHPVVNLATIARDKAAAKKLMSTLKKNK
jgi:hypothetical protein